MSRWAWIPIPILFLTMMIFWQLDLRTQRDFPGLLLVVDFFSRTLTSFLVVYLAGRSFLLHRDWSILMLGCGVAIWSLSGLVATSTLTHDDLNLGITISNCGIGLAGLCHLIGVSRGHWMNRSLPIRRAGLTLTLVALGVLGTVSLITFLAMKDALPLFFDQGGTPLRHFVLGSSLAMFLATAYWLWRASRLTHTSFTRWYSLALMLITTSISGMILQTSATSALNWTCRITQYLSGLYLLMAALGTIRQSGLWQIPLEAILERTQAKLQQAQRQAQIIEERFRLALQNSPVAVAVQDVNLVYLWGYNLQSGPDIAGKTDADLFAPEDLPAILAAKRRVISSGLKERAQQWITHQGQRFFLDLYLEPTRDASGAINGIGVATVNLTAQKKAEEAILRAKELSDTLYRINALLHSSLETHQIIRHLMAQGAAALGSSSAAVSFRESNQWRVAYLHNMPEKHIGSLMNDQQEWHALLAIQSGEPVAVANAYDDPRGDCRHLRSHEIRSVLTIPLLTRDRPIGVLFFNFQSAPHTFDDLEINFARQLAATAAIALENARLFEECRVAQENLQAAMRSAEEAKAAALAANQAKNHFLAVLSHELRTPLNPVLATAALLRNDPTLDAALQEKLEVICRNAELEARLIDDLLDVMRIERGKIELHHQVLELSELLKQTLEVCRPDIDTRRLHLELTGGPYWVQADAARLQQVFWNLLKNAIKFTPPQGDITLRLRRESDRQVRVEVIDMGEGIPPEALGRIFNAFEQAERSITRQFGGLGLGLTISKALVEMHGGTIQASSPGKGHGATFSVFLPLEDPMPVAQGPAISPAASAGSGGKSLRILLVEDHPDTARTMGWLLKANGHSVRTAGDAKGALKLADEEPFDLLLSDLGLPDASGLELLGMLRRRGKLFPAIALSGYGQEKDLQRSHEAGFARHLTKPIHPERLETALQQMMQGP